MFINGFDDHLWNELDFLNSVLNEGALRGKRLGRESGL